MIHELYLIKLLLSKRTEKVWPKHWLAEKRKAKRARIGQAGAVSHKSRSQGTNEVEKRNRSRRAAGCRWGVGAGSLTMTATSQSSALQADHLRFFPIFLLGCDFKSCP